MSRKPHKKAAAARGASIRAAHAKPADAPAKHWTDALPKPLPAMARLSRWDRPVGWQLLFLPCLMGMALARAEDGFWPMDATLALLFLAGAIAMRGAGCTYNDILDRDIDAKVARTRARPLPAKQISVSGAWIWLFAQCAVGLLVLLALPRIAQIAALCAIPFVAAYPLMKRVTWWPQAWLGITFSWGALVGYLAIRQEIAPEMWLLYAGCIAWTIAYDTIYALQDREDDALVGVRSTARLFGGKWKAWTYGFYALALFLWAAAAYQGASGIAAILILSALGVAIFALVDRADPKHAETALAAFKQNVWLGVGVLMAFAAAPLWLTFKGFGF